MFALWTTEIYTAHALIFVIPTVLYLRQPHTIWMDIWFPYTYKITSLWGCALGLFVRCIWCRARARNVRTCDQTSAAAEVTSSAESRTHTYSHIETRKPCAKTSTREEHLLKRTYDRANIRSVRRVQRDQLEPRRVIQQWIGGPIDTQRSCLRKKSSSHRRQRRRRYSNQIDSN